MFNEVRLAIANGQLEEDALTEASSYLLRKQFLFRHEARDKKHYLLIERHLTLFDKAMRFFGGELVMNHEAGYVGYVPNKPFSTMDLTQTAILLTLRLIYHEEKIKGASEFAYITVSGSQFLTQYKLWTQRQDLEGSKTQFYKTLQPLKSKSIIRFGDVEDEETELKEIIILPTIEAVINQAYAIQLIQDLQAQMPNVEASSNSLGRVENEQASTAQEDLDETV